MLHVAKLNLACLPWYLRTKDSPWSSETQSWIPPWLPTLELSFFWGQEYFQNHHGDWLAVDFKAAKERDELSKHFKVEGIPSFLADWWWIWMDLGEGTICCFSLVFLDVFLSYSLIFIQIHTSSSYLQVAWRCCCNFQAHRAKPKSFMSSARMWLLFF